MPFMGQDWRSPGEEWVKTDEGWERKKLLERLRRNVRESMELESHFINNVNDNDSMVDSHVDHNMDDSQAWQPFCPITLKCTREIAGFNGLSEAFKRLDFRNAVRDIRRFNYICKLLHLLITQNLTMLSGCAQKVLFTMLEEVASQVSNNQTNIHILQKLLGDLQKTLIEYYCWGRPLGSTQLWDHHKRTINRINSIAQCIVIKPDETIQPKLQDLPEEVVREVMLRMTDHTDLQNSAKAYSVMNQILDETHIWRELCRFHFTSQQIRHVLTNTRRASFAARYNNHHLVNRRASLHPSSRVNYVNNVNTGGSNVGVNEDNNLGGSSESVQLPPNDNAMFKLENIDWQDTYHKLRRKYGLKEEYAEILQLCRQCRCLFWKSFGHPCIGDLSGTNPGETEQPTAAQDPAASPPASPPPDKSTLYVPITPQAFLKFFSL